MNRLFVLPLRIIDELKFIHTKRRSSSLCPLQQDLDELIFVSQPVFVRLCPHTYVMVHTGVGEDGASLQFTSSCSAAVGLCAGTGV